MKFRLRKTRKGKYTKRKTYKHFKGGNNLVIKYNDLIVSGEKISKLKTTLEPSVNFSPIGKLYTIVMWDPDVDIKFKPSWVHWIAINLKSPNDIQNNQLLEYNGPSPPSGTHRYFFSLFEQQNTINPKKPKRPNFSINDFVAKNNLKEVSKLYMTVSANA